MPRSLTAWDQDPKEFEAGQLVYIPDEVSGWAVAEVVGAESNKVEVSYKDNTVTLNASEVIPASSRAREGVNDMAGHGSSGLDTLHESALLDNVHVRYDRDDIFTNCSSKLLVSLNPYRVLDIFGEETLDQYIRQSLKDDPTQPLPPHLYAVADEAYCSMLKDKKSHAILISGESGSGKTEATKYLLRYIIERSAASSCSSPRSPAKKFEARGHTIERRILDSNPLLEAFGNAKTERNDNSSRFGKYFTLDFDRQNQLTGARLTTYLLEKSRVTTQLTGERNFHIFYQLCAGLPDEDREELGILDADKFCILALSECIEIEGVDDAENFDKVKEALVVFGFTAEEQRDLWRVLGAILQLGNLCFEDNEEGQAVLINPKVLHTVARLLRVAPAALLRALSEKAFSGGRRRSVATVALDSIAAIDSGNALARALYSHIFDWLVRRINVCLSGESAKGKPAYSIGVLDIFGFECFQTNSFEQLCINYANEKLHQQFLNEFFKMEMTDFEKEGLKMDEVKFQDNSPCLELLEAVRPAGVFGILQEECSLPGKKGTDLTFTEKLRTLLKGKPHFEKIHPKYGPEIFAIGHYPGTVMYTSYGFLEKNKDTMRGEIEQVLETSLLPFVKTLMGGAMRASEHKRVTTVGNLFREQLGELVKHLNSAKLHFVRCIKPNHTKEAQCFDGTLVLRQMRYIGLMDLVMVRRNVSIYVNRMLYVDVHAEHEFMTANQKPKDVAASRKFVSKLVEQTLKLDPNKYALGKTKIFMKDHALVMYLAHRHACLVRSQAGVRGFLTRKEIRRQREAATFIQSCWRRWKAVKLRRKLLHEKRERSAVRIQKSFRGHQGRQEFVRRQAERALQVRAATAIEAHYRGHKAHKEFKREKESAILIESRYRGHLARMKVQQMKRELAEAERLKAELEAEAKAKAEEAARIAAEAAAADAAAQEAAALASHDAAKEKWTRASRLALKVAAEKAAELAAAEEAAREAALKAHEATKERWVKAAKLAAAEAAEAREREKLAELEALEAAAAAEEEELAAADGDDLDLATAIMNNAGSAPPSEAPAGGEAEALQELFNAGGPSNWDEASQASSAAPAPAPPPPPLPEKVTRSTSTTSLTPDPADLDAPGPPVIYSLEPPVEAEGEGEDEDAEPALATRRPSTTAQAAADAIAKINAFDPHIQRANGRGVEDGEAEAPHEPANATLRGLEASPMPSSIRHRSATVNTLISPKLTSLLQPQLSPSSTFMPIPDYQPKAAEAQSSPGPSDSPPAAAVPAPAPVPAAPAAAAAPVPPAAAPLPPAPAPLVSTPPPAPPSAPSPPAYAAAMPPAASSPSYHPEDGYGDLDRAAATLSPLRPLYSTARPSSATRVGASATERLKAMGVSPLSAHSHTPRGGSLIGAGARIVAGTASSPSSATTSSERDLINSLRKMLEAAWAENGRTQKLYAASQARIRSLEKELHETKKFSEVLEREVEVLSKGWDTRGKEPAARLATWQDRGANSIGREGIVRLAAAENQVKTLSAENELYRSAMSDTLTTFNKPPAGSTVTWDQIQELEAHLELLEWQNRCLKSSTSPSKSPQPATPATTPSVD